MDEPTAEYEKDGHISLAGGDVESGSTSASYGNVSLSAPSAPPASSSPTKTDPPLFHGGGGGSSGVTHATANGVTISSAPASFDERQRPSTMSQEMVTEVASQAMRGAGRALRRGASEVRVYVQANPYSITMMSFFGGLWLILASTVTLLNIGSFFTNTLAWILQGYQVFFGLIIVIVDGPQDKLPQFLRDKMMSYVSFMHNNKSRFIFYLFIACQQGSQNNWPSWLTGWYFAAVAAGYALVQLTSAPEGSNSEGPNTALASAEHRV